MDNNQLLVFLKAELQNGKAPDAIKTELVAKGYNQQDIIHALQSLSTPQTAPQENIVNQGLPNNINSKPFSYVATGVRQEDTSSKGMNIAISLLAVLIIGVVVAGAVFLFKLGFLSKSNKSAQQSLTTIQKPSPIPTLIPTLLPTQTPYTSLAQAAEKTINSKFLSSTFTSTVNTNISSSKTGVTQTVGDNMDGTITGATDGSKYDLEVKMYTPSLPNLAVNISSLNPGDGNIYTKNSKVGLKWQKETMQQNLQDTQPTDASLYGLTLLGSVFSPSQALFKAFSTSDVTKMDDITSGTVTTSVYSVNIDLQKFISYLATDNTNPTRLAADSKIILQNSSLNVTYYIDNSTGYISKIHIEAKKLAQIPTPQAEQAGISASQDIVMDVNFSDYGKQTIIDVPFSTNVLGASTSIFQQYPALPLNK